MATTLKRIPRRPGSYPGRPKMPTIDAKRGEAINHRRIALGLTQSELAACIEGARYTTIGHAENGTAKSPMTYALIERVLTELEAQSQAA